MRVTAVCLCSKCNRCIEGYEQGGDRALVKCKESLAVLRKSLSSILVYCKNNKVVIPKRVSNYLTMLQEELKNVFELLPACKLHVYDFRDLADGINRLRANKTLDCSPALIVNCCLFICIFVEEDFTEGEFSQLINDFNPKKDGFIVNKDKK